MNNVCGIKATEHTCNGNYRIWTRRCSMKCFERIASFYLPKYLIATYIVEITSGWRVIETIASFRTIFYRTPCKTKIKKSHNIFHANNLVILTQKMFDQCFQIRHPHSTSEQRCACASADPHHIQATLLLGSAHRAVV